MPSRIGGDSGCIADIGTGVSFRIDAITMAWLAPSNARRPVTIS